MEIQNPEITQISKTLENSNAKTKVDIPKEFPKADEIQAWLISSIAEKVEIGMNEVDITVPFDRYGLDSSAALGLTGDLEDWLGYELDPTLLYDYNTIEILTEHLVQESTALFG